MRIRAVFFDMGGTLQTFDSTRQGRLDATPGLQQHLLAAGIDLHLNTDQLEAVVTEGLDRYKRWCIESMEELPPYRVWHEFVLGRQDVDRTNLERVAEELSFYIETHFYSRAMRPEIPAVLEAIRKMGLKIGLISNVNSRQQVPANLNEYGICHYFDPIVLSSEYGRRKPDPAIFHYAARLAHVPTSACAYIGDRIARDIEGARRAGFGLAIQIEHDFDHGESDEGPAPDAVVRSMAEVLDILGSRVAEPTDAAAPGRIRALLFDAGDILYYRPNRGRRFNAFLRELAIDAADRPAREKEALTQQAYMGAIDQAHYHASILGLYGITRPDLVERGRQALRDDEDDVEFFPGVQQTLVALKEQGYLLAIVTDTANPVHTKLKWFERGGFGHVWDSIISSRELGMRKPDPRIYCAALDQLGVTAIEALFVGHKAGELDGARNAGIWTVAFNYDREAVADYFIKDFPELLQLSLLRGNEELHEAAKR